MKYPFQIFGSQSSMDYDVLVFVDKLGSIQENHETITAIELELAEILTDKPINANLGVVEDGMLIRVFKGYPFEVNNSCYNTYDNHHQYYPNHITKTYELTEDIKHFKLKRCLRFILSFYSRVPEWRADIKAALRGNFQLRLDQCKKIDLTLHTDFPKKNETKVDIYKVLAFQLAQTIHLWRGIEIYSKEEAIKHYPHLTPFLLRQEITSEDLKRLNFWLLVLLDISEHELPKMKSLDEEILNPN